MPNRVLAQRLAKSGIGGGWKESAKRKREGSDGPKNGRINRKITTTEFKQY